MGYLDNSVVTIDAILTKKGRELLARNDGSFRITQFAMADDEVDYTLYNPNHPSGSAFYGEAIENMRHGRRPSAGVGRVATRVEVPVQGDGNGEVGDTPPEEGVG